MSDILRSLDLHIIRGILVVNSVGKEIHFRLSPDSSTPFFSVKRSLFDHILLNNAQKAGTTVMQDARVVDISHLEKWKVTVQVNRDMENFASTFLIGADGRNSIVAGKIGARKWNYSPWSTKLRVGIQWHAPFQPQAGTQIQLHLFGSGYCGVVNVDEHTSNIAMVTSPTLAQLAMSNFPAFLDETILNNPSLTRKLANPVPLDGINTTFPINPFTRHSSEPTAFLVGDARRTVEPFTGEGICMALHDGIVTAKRILALFRTKTAPQFARRKNAFWVNGIYSPVLRNRRLAEAIVSLSARYSSIARILGRRVLGPALQ